MVYFVCRGIIYSIKKKATSLWICLPSDDQLMATGIFLFNGQSIVVLKTWINMVCA